MCANQNMLSVQISLRGESEGVEKKKAKTYKQKQLDEYVNTSSNLVT